jgi:hypothetical protein
MRRSNTASRSDKRRRDRLSGQLLAYPPVEVTAMPQKSNYRDSPDQPASIPKNEDDELEMAEDDEEFDDDEDLDAEDEVGEDEDLDE